MAFSFPRISITVDDGNERGTQGELGTLAFGFGIHLAWTYCVLFNSELTFSGVRDAMTFCPFFLVAVVAFAILTLFTSITDQKLLRFYTDRPAMILAAGFSVVGTAVALISHLTGQADGAFIVGGALCGIGSGLFTMLWGTAYARYNTASIVLNSVVAVVFATLLYSLVIHVLPWPFVGVIACVLPLFELPLLWKLTPISYALRHAVPIFNPLPIRKVTFMLRFSIPILLFGITLGVLKDVGLTRILPSVDPTVQLIALFAGGTAAIVLMVVAFSIDKRSHWDFLFRPLIPFVAFTLLFLPWFQESAELIPSLLLLTGFLCLGSLMWALLGQLAQEFRLSPICMFGIGSTAIAIGTILGVYLVENPSSTGWLPFGEGSLVVVLLISLMFAMALLPRVRDIKRIILPHTGEDGAPIAEFNKEIDQAKAILQSRPRPHGASAWTPRASSCPSRGPPAPRRADPWPTTRRSSVGRSRDPKLRRQPSCPRMRRATRSAPRCAGASARSARRSPTATCFRAARPRSCSSWPRATTPRSSRRSSASPRAPRRPTSATSTASSTSTTSKSCWRWWTPPATAKTEKGTVTFSLRTRRRKAARWIRVGPCHICDVTRGRPRVILLARDLDDRGVILEQLLGLAGLGELDVESVAVDLGHLATAERLVIDHVPGRERHLGGGLLPRIA